MTASFDGFGREETRAWVQGGLNLISSFTNTYNDRHDRTKEVWNHFGGYYTEVDLDSLSRTIASRFKTDPNTLIPTENSTYDIDGVHNRITVTTNGVPTAYSTNSINAYPTVGGVNRTYDVNGNLLSDGTNFYTYNYNNDLIEVRRASDNFLLGSYKTDARSPMLGTIVARTSEFNVDEARA